MLERRKHNASKISGLVLCIFITLASGGCGGTRYVPFEAAEKTNSLPMRTVAVEINPEFFEDFPNCVVVMPPKASASAARYSRSVESALSRHLTVKISRVVSLKERNLVARRMGVDMRHPGDFRDLMKELGCDTYVKSEVVGAGKSFLLVWSKMRIGLDVSLLRVGGERPLWRARHVAGRSDGGISLSPVGVVVNAFMALRFSADRDVDVSVVEDAVRRLVYSMPDAKIYHRWGSFRSVSGRQN